jgi:hypothetical protein
MHLHPIDWLIISAYAAAILAIGFTVVTAHRDGGNSGWHRSTNVGAPTTGALSNNIGSYSTAKGASAQPCEHGPTATDALTIRP